MKIILLFMLLLMSCGNAFHQGSSSSLEESITNDIFLSNYKCVSTKKNIQDEILSKVENCFLEKGFYMNEYGGGVDTNRLNLLPNNLVFIGGKKNMDFIVDNYTIHSRNGKLSRVTSGVLSVDVSQKSDTIYLEVHRIDISKKMYKGEYVGEIILY